MSFLRMYRTLSVPGVTCFFNGTLLLEEAPYNIGRNVSKIIFSRKWHDYNPEGVSYSLTFTAQVFANILLYSCIIVCASANKDTMTQIFKRKLRQRCKPM